MHKIAFGHDPERHQQLWSSIYIKLSFELRVAIRIPFAINEHSKIKMGALIIEVVTMEPCSEVGREISQTVCQGFSHKGQYAFLGDSLIGGYCKLCTMTCNSNSILIYSTFKIWDFNIKKFINIELHFYRTTMGHRSKFSIASHFNVGMLVIIGANIMGYRVQIFLILFHGSDTMFYHLSN